MARSLGPRHCSTDIVRPNEPIVAKYSGLLRIAGLAVLLGCHLAMATIPALFAMNIANLSSHPELDKFLTNVGYGIVAGAVLVLIVAIFERLWFLIKSDAQ